MHICWESPFPLVVLISIRFVSVTCKSFFTSFIQFGLISIFPFLLKFLILQEYILSLLSNNFFFFYFKKRSVFHRKEWYGDIGWFVELLKCPCIYLSTICTVFFLTMAFSCVMQGITLLLLIIHTFFPLSYEGFRIYWKSTINQLKVCCFKILLKNIIW